MSVRRLGVNFTARGSATIKLWAPLLSYASVKVNNSWVLDLEKQAYGYWSAETVNLKPGDTYAFIVDGKELPDPVSVYQPYGVHGPSQAVDLNAFNWTDDRWENPAQADYILYELHTGTFSPEANFKGIEEKLDYLVELGITAIEIMPVAQFPGERNWGYDGVFPFAVQNSYGGYEGLQQLVNACHQKGLAVVLDVVYNHLGPEGNYLPAFAPYFTEKYKTPWGDALNYDDAWCDGVREYFIENALMWFRDFHIDALRLDAVHAIKDFSPKHILKEIKENVDRLSEETGRKYHLIIECDLNDTRYINPLNNDGYGMDAQWTDEFHHALRVTAGQEKDGYYSDFLGVKDLAKAYTDAYVYTGQYSAQRFKRFGMKTDNPGGQFIVFSQNHDQVGNRMLGERTSTLHSFEMQKLLAAAVMVSPYVPMLFMGEEWSAHSPFLYFVSHGDEELIKAVQKGRKEEFKDFHGEGEAPDPQSEDTLNRSKLNWDELQQAPSQIMFRYYKALIELKKSNPVIKSHDRKNLSAQYDEQANTLQLLRWNDQERGLCVMNFSNEQQALHFAEAGEWQKLFSSADAEWSGQGDTPKAIHQNQILTLWPESIAIFSQHV